MSRWPTGVAVVTSSAGGQPVGCTVSAFMSVSLRPTLLLVALATSSGTLTGIQEHGRFAVNVLSSGQGALSERFARGSRDSRFADLDYAWTLGVPVLRDAAAGVVCAVERCLPVGDHVLVVAAPVRTLPTSGAVPTVRFRHSYWRLDATTTA